MVIHSYRHRFGLVLGDPAVEDIERQLTTQPRITVPTIALHGAANGLVPLRGSEHHDRLARARFTAAYEHRVIPLMGHNLPQEAPRDFAAAVLSLI